MNAIVIIVIAVVLTALTILISRGGARNHQEELSTHAADPRDGGSLPTEPVAADRPADAEAEPMGVRDAGEPSVERHD